MGQRMERFKNDIFWKSVKYLTLLCFKIKPIQQAVLGGQVNIVECLIAHNVEVNVGNQAKKETPMSMALAAQNK